MIKSFLLAAVLLANSNFLPLHFVGLKSLVLPQPGYSTVKQNAPLLSSTFPTSNSNIKTSSYNVYSASSVFEAEEDRFMQLINMERTSRGENALIEDPLLTAAARAHSQEMCNLNYFSHHSPTDGSATPMDRYLNVLHAVGQQTPSYLLVGENIYYCSVFNSHYNVDYGHQALMNSPGHRANILDPQFTDVGVGVYQDAQGQFWVTELFMSDQQ